MGKPLAIVRIIRDFLFSTANKQFLIFLFFLAMSGSFWLVMTLNETYEAEVLVPVRIVNVPKNVVITSDETDTARVTIRDKGIMLASYLYGQGVKELKLNFKSYAKSHDRASVSSGEIQNLLANQLSASTKIISVKPARIDFAYNYGQSKKVPVKWSGRVMPEHLYFISHVGYSPDSVVVYAPKERLDSIQYVLTEPLNYAGFRDTLRVKCELQKSRGVKFVPDKVSITFYTDVLTEEDITDVPIQCVNMPPGKVLRTFPSKVSINFVAGVSLIRKLSVGDFTVVVDYHDIEQNPSDKCKLYIKKVPHGVSKATLSLQQVDYLIEEE